MEILIYKTFVPIGSGVLNSLFNHQRPGDKFALVSYSPGICNTTILMQPLYVK